MSNPIELDDAKLLLEKDLQISQTMIKAFQNLIKNQAEAHKQYSNIETTFINVKELDEQETVAQQFEDLHKLQKKLNQVQQDYINNTQNKVQVSLSSFEQEIKLLKNKIADFQSKEKNATKKINSLEKKLDNEEGQEEQIKGQIQELEEEQERNEVNVMNRTKQYVDDRNSELKSLVQQYVNTEIKKHSDSLQLLTEFNKKLQDK